MSAPTETRRRRIDNGEPLIFHCDERPFALQARACSNPRCTCTTIGVEVLRAETTARGTFLVHEPQMAVSYDLAARRFGASHRAAGVSEALGQRVLAALTADTYHEWLAERFERQRGAEDEGQLPRGWRVGEVASYSEVFPRDFDILLTHDNRRLLVDDSYCLAPDCRCADAWLTLVDVVSGAVAATVRASLPTLTIREVTNAHLPRAVVDRLVHDLDPTVIRARFRRMRRFARTRLVRSAGARRAAPTAPTAAPVFRATARVEALWIVWRAVELSAEHTLGDLARALAGALGWPAPPRPEVCGRTDDGRAYGYTSSLPLDLGRTLGSLEHTRLGLTIGAWRLDVRLRVTTESRPGARLPRSVDGEGAAPPPSCKDADAYLSLVDAFLDSEDPEHEAAAHRLGEAFDERLWPEGAALEGAAAADDLPADAGDLARVLGQLGGLLPERTIERVRALEGAGAALARILEAAVDEVDPSWTTVHAVELAGELRSELAVAPLMALVQRTAPDSVLQLALQGALVALGDLALEALLAGHDSGEEMTRVSIRGALAQLDVHDPRIQSRLLAALSEGAPMSAVHLGQYGDAATIEHLRRAAARERKEGRAGGEFALSVAEALVALGDEEAQAPAVRDAGRPAPAKASARPGRNEPCWCGSGKKYKKCHLDADASA